MSKVTTDPTDPRLGHGVDTEPTPQQEAYLVLSPDERAKGFVRPLRTTYRHVGARGPRLPLRDLTPEEQECYADAGYVKFEEYPESESPITGRFWTAAQLDEVGNGCGRETTISSAIAETYAREPIFYGATYCCHCQMHRPVAEFVWLDGTEVGS